MKSTIVQVPFKEGLHARPASEITKLCQKFVSDIKFIKDTAEIDPKSILGILTLGASKGDKIQVEVFGEDEEEALNVIEEFFRKE